MKSMQSKMVKRKEWNMCEEEAQRIKEDVVNRRKEHDKEGYMRRTRKVRSYETKEDNRKYMTPKEPRKRRDHPY